MGMLRLGEVKLLPQLTQLEKGGVRVLYSDVSDSEILHCCLACLIDSYFPHTSLYF